MITNKISCESWQLLMRLTPTCLYAVRSKGNKSPSSQQPGTSTRTRTGQSDGCNLIVCTEYVKYVSQLRSTKTALGDMPTVDRHLSLVTRSPSMCHILGCWSFPASASHAEVHTTESWDILCCYTCSSRDNRARRISHSTCSTSSNG